MKYAKKGSRKVKASKKPSTNIRKDVAILKRKINRSKPEVKTTDMTQSSMVVGQVKVNLTGSNCFQIPIAIGNGTANAGRIGNEVYLIGNYLRMQFRQQSAGAIATRYIVEVWKTNDVNLTAGSTGSLLPILFNADSISGVIDYNSSRLMQYRNVYKRVFSKKITLPADSTSSVNTTRDFKYLIKDRQKLQWPDPTGTSPNNMWYYVTVRADSGNCDTSSASTLPLIAQTAVNTGCVVSYCCKSYYTDS